MINDSLGLNVSKRRKSTLSPRKSYEIESFIRRTLTRYNDKTYVLTLNTVINELMVSLFVFKSGILSHGSLSETLSKSGCYSSTFTV